jgi:hypothetical protein
MAHAIEVQIKMKAIANIRLVMITTPVMIDFEVQDRPEQCGLPHLDKGNTPLN